MTWKPKHTWRPNALQSERTVVSGHDGLELRNKKGDVTRRIPWNRVKKMQQYQSATARTADGSRVPLLAFKVQADRGGSITFLSGTYTGPGGDKVNFRDGSDQFLPVVRDIKRRVAAVNPQVTLTTGDAGYSIMFGIVVLALFLLATFGVAALARLPQMDGHSWLLIAQVVLLLLVAGPAALYGMKAWKPVSTTVAADLQEETS